MGCGDRAGEGGTAWGAGVGQEGVGQHGVYWVGVGWGCGGVAWVLAMSNVTGSKPYP